MLVRQLEEEVVKSRQHAKETNPEIKAHIEALQIENDALTREIAILKETIKVRIVGTYGRTEKVLCLLVKLQNMNECPSMIALFSSK